MAIVVHMRSSTTYRLPYGRDEARVFLNDILPEAPDVSVQIAHLAGAGGYSDPSIDPALRCDAKIIAQTIRPDSV
jgi:sirohydrochlorin ferrochelatase